MREFICQFFRAYLAFAAYIGLVIGLGLTASGIVSLALFGWIALNSVDVTAEVVRVDEKTSNNTRLYRPVFEASPPSGSRVEYAGTSWFSPKPHRVGETVMARYNPKTGVIVSENTRVLTADTGLSLIVSGLIFFAIGLALRKWSFRSTVK